MRNYLKNRERAMAWVNGNVHDFEVGLSILRDAGFKPGVVSMLARHGKGVHQSDERLMYHMRDFIKCYANPKAKEDTDIIIGIVEGKKILPDNQENDKIPSMFSDSVKEQLDNGGFPEPIAKVICNYRDAFVKRDKLTRQLAELPETNNEETVEKRRIISDEMKTLSDTMDKLYPQYEAYVTSGSIPTEAPTSPTKGKSAGTDSSTDKTELQKKRKSIATKIRRAKNMLLYQTETKQEEENPLTDPKKVAKYQAKIDRLTQELNDIDMQIAVLA